MSVLNALEVLGWTVFGAWLVFLFVRLAMRKTSTADKRWNTQVMCWALLVCGPLFLVVYSLDAFGVADAAMDSDRRGKGPLFMASCGLLMTLSSVWALRKLGRGETD